MDEIVWILTYKKECNSDSDAPKYTIETFPSEELANYRMKELESKNIEYSLRQYKMPVLAMLLK